jgi:hypothetical protein
LTDAEVIALTQAAAQMAGWAARTLRDLTGTLQQNDPTAQARAARLSVALIAAAPPMRRRRTT